MRSEWDVCVQINNAGEGGLYAEMIQDRSFDALSTTSGSDEKSMSDRTSDFLGGLQRQHMPRPARKLSENAKQHLTPKHELSAIKSVFICISLRICSFCTKSKCRRALHSDKARD